MGYVTDLKAQQPRPIRSYAPTNATVSHPRKLRPWLGQISGAYGAWDDTYAAPTEREGAGGVDTTDVPPLAGLGRREMDDLEENDRSAFVGRLRRGEQRFQRSSEQSGRKSGGRSPGRGKQAGIAASTVIVPMAIAIAVWEEASQLLGTTLPRGWICKLTHRADAVFRHNRKFRSRVCAAGGAGRDYLWRFMRHWISGLLFEHDPALAARLPKGYNVGRV